MHLYFQQIYGSKHSFLPIILRTLYFKEKPYCPLRPLRGHLSHRERQVVCANFEQADKLKLRAVEMLGAFMPQVYPSKTDASSICLQKVLIFPLDNGKIRDMMKKKN